MTLVPAYGRDYKSKAAVLADFNANKDFRIADVFSGADGKVCNLEDLKRSGVRSVNIRYSKLSKVAVIKL